MNFLPFKKINKESISTENNIKSIISKIKDEIESAKVKFYNTKPRNYLTSLIRVNMGSGIPIENYINDIKKIFNKYGSVTPCEEYKEKNMNGYKNCELNKVKYYTMLKNLLIILKNNNIVKEFMDNNYKTKFIKYINKKSDDLQKEKIDKHKSRSNEKSLSEKKNNRDLEGLEGGKKILKKSVKK